METLTLLAVAAAALLGGRADARLAAADVLRPAPTLAAAVAAQAPPPDVWFGDDKLRHFAMSIATATFAYAAARTAGADDVALPGALAVAAAAGVGKEVYDRRIGRPFSLRDLAWDALGVAVGYAFLRQLE